MQRTEKPKRRAKYTTFIIKDFKDGKEITKYHSFDGKESFARTDQRPGAGSSSPSSSSDNNNALRPNVPPIPAARPPHNSARAKPGASLNIFTLAPHRFDEDLEISVKLDKEEREKRRQAKAQTAAPAFAATVARRRGPRPRGRPTYAVQQARLARRTQASSTAKSRKHYPPQPDEAADSDAACDAKSSLSPGTDPEFHLNSKKHLSAEQKPPPPRRKSSPSSEADSQEESSTDDSTATTSIVDEIIQDSDDQSGRSNHLDAEALASISLEPTSASLTSQELPDFSIDWLNLLAPSQAVNSSNANTSLPTARGAVENISAERFFACHRSDANDTSDTPAPAPAPEPAPEPTPEPTPEPAPASEGLQQVEQDPLPNPGPSFVTEFRPPPLDLNLSSTNSTSLKRGSSLLSARTPNSSLYMKFLCLSPSPSTSQFQRIPSRLQGETGNPLDDPRASSPLQTAATASAQSLGLLSSLTSRRDSSDTFNNVLDRMREQGLVPNHYQAPPHTPSAAGGAASFLPGLGIMPTPQQRSFTSIASSTPMLPRHLSSTDLPPLDSAAPQPEFHAIPQPQTFGAMQTTQPVALQPEGLVEFLHNNTHFTELWTAGQLDAPAPASAFAQELFPSEFPQMKRDFDEVDAMFHASQPAPMPYVMSQNPCEPSWTSVMGDESQMDCDNTYDRSFPGPDLLSMSTNLEALPPVHPLSDASDAIVAWLTPLQSLAHTEIPHHLTTVQDGQDQYTPTPRASIGDETMLIDASQGPLLQGHDSPDTLRALGCDVSPLLSVNPSIAAEGKDADMHVDSCEQAFIVHEWPTKITRVPREGSDDCLKLFAQIISSYQHSRQLSLMRSKAKQNKKTAQRSMGRMVWQLMLDAPGNPGNPDFANVRRCMFPNCVHSLIGFRRGCDLAVHIVTQHASRQALNCEFCYRHFGRKATLLKHHRENHHENQRLARQEPEQDLEDFIESGFALLPRSLRKAVKDAAALCELGEAKDVGVDPDWGYESSEEDEEAASDSEASDSEYSSVSASEVEDILDDVKDPSWIERRRHGTADLTQSGAELSEHFEDSDSDLDSDVEALDRDEIHDIVSEVLELYTAEELTEPQRKRMVRDIDDRGEYEWTYGTAELSELPDRDLVEAGINADLISDAMKASMWEEVAATKAMSTYLFTNSLGVRPVRDLLARSSRPAIADVNIENHHLLVQKSALRRGVQSIRRVQPLSPASRRENFALQRQAAWWGHAAPTT